MARLLTVILFTLLSAVSLASNIARDTALDVWSVSERGLIDAMLIDNLGSPPADASNKFADKQNAVNLGRKIFNDMRFSANGKVSCASCHRDDYNFTDELPLAKGMGTTDRRSMPAVGMAYQRWFFWDGRKDSSWAQALTPLENPVEHGISRTRVAQLVYEHYRNDYQGVFGPLPDTDVSVLSPLAFPSANDKLAMKQWQAMSQETRDQVTAVFVNTGKALAAFVRTLKPAGGAFDDYARALAADDEQGLESLTPQQTRGLRLFVTKAKCINCHNGPLLSNGEFHHVGIHDKGEADRGRAAVIETVALDEFSCLGRWSDADPNKDCAHVRFLDTSNPVKYERAFKTPSLRDVATRPPYMHAGQFVTLSEVLINYRAVSGKLQTDEIFHNVLNDEELAQLEAFLHALTTQEHE